MEDAKTAVGMSKEVQDKKSTRIKDFVVTVTGSSEEDALKKLAIATPLIWL